MGAVNGKLIIQLEWPKGKSDMATLTSTGLVSESNPYYRMYDHTCYTIYLVQYTLQIASDGLDKNPEKLI